MFCPKCKSILLPGEDGLECGCGYRSKGRLKFKEKTKPPKDIEVVDEEASTGESEVPIVCWNCGKRGVYFWMRQMARADEAPTRFYRCKHCKKVWRSSK